MQPTLPDLSRAGQGRYGECTRFERASEGGHDGVERAVQESALLLSDPGIELLAAGPMGGLAGLPELLGDVVPVEGDLGVWEELLLKVPDDVGAISEKVDAGEAVSPIAALHRLGVEPLEERAVAHEGCDDSLVERPIEHAVFRTPQRV